MITRDQIVLERLENELDQSWHLMQSTEHKQLIYNMLRAVRAEIAAICSQQDK